MGKSRGYNCWSPEEEDALRNGVAKHGLGAWEIVRKDPEFSILGHRSGVQLKDKFRNLVKFRHVSLEEAKALKPKGSGPWSRKLSASALTQATSMCNAVSGSDGQGTNSQEGNPDSPGPAALEGGTQLSALDVQDTHATSESPFGSLMLQAPIEMKIEVLNIPEVKQEEMAVDDGGDLPLDDELGPWTTSQRRKRRLHEDRRFGIYDQRRYSGKPGAGGSMPPMRRRHSRTGSKLSGSRSRGGRGDEFSDEFDEEEDAEEDERGYPEDDDDDDGEGYEGQHGGQGGGGGRGAKAAAHALDSAHRPVRHSARSRAALRDFWRRAAAGEPMEDGDGEDDGSRGGIEGGAADFVVRCMCGVCYDDGAPMIECEHCKVWSHIECLKLKSASDPVHFSYDCSNYLCFGCQHGLRGGGGGHETGVHGLIPFDPTSLFPSAALGRFLENILAQQLQQNGGCGVANGHQHSCVDDGRLTPLALAALHGLGPHGLGPPAEGLGAGQQLPNLFGTDPGSLLLGLSNGGGHTGGRQSGSKSWKAGRSGHVDSPGVGGAEAGSTFPDSGVDVGGSMSGQAGSRGGGRSPAPRAGGPRSGGGIRGGTSGVKSQASIGGTSDTTNREDQLSLFLSAGPNSRQLERERELQQLLQQQRQQIHQQLARQPSPCSEALAAAVRLRPDVLRPQPQTLSAPRPLQHPDMQRHASQLSLTQLSAAAGGKETTSEGLPCGGSAAAVRVASVDGSSRLSPALINSLMHRVGSNGSPRNPLVPNREGSFASSILGGGANGAGGTRPGSVVPPPRVGSAHPPDLGAIFGESDDECHGGSSIFSGTLLDNLRADHLLMGLLGGSRAATPASSIFLDNFLRGTPDLHLTSIASPGADHASQLQFLSALHSNAAHAQAQAAAGSGRQPSLSEKDKEELPQQPPPCSSALPWKLSSNNVYAPLMQGILTSSPDPNAAPPTHCPAAALEPRSASGGFKPVARSASVSKDDLLKLDSFLEAGQTHSTTSSGDGMRGGINQSIQRELNQLMTGSSSGALSLLEGLRAGTPDPWAALLNRTGTPGPTAEMLALHGFSMPPLGGDFSAAPWLLRSTPPLPLLDIGLPPHLMSPKMKLEAGGSSGQLETTGTSGQLQAAEVGVGAAEGNEEAGGTARS